MILLHPYMLVLYGIILWQIEQHISSKINTDLNKKKVTLRDRANYIGRSLIWGSAIVVFDDEILDFLYDNFEVDFEAEWYFYLGAGFFIDIIRNKFTKEK